MAMVAFQNIYVFVRHINHYGNTIVFQLQRNVITKNSMGPTIRYSLLNDLSRSKG